MVKRGLPCLNTINDALYRIIESGFVDKWVDESQVNVNKTSVADYEDTEGLLDLERIFSAFIFLGGGFLISFFAFLTELFYCKIYKKQL